MTNISPLDNELNDLIKTNEYREILGKVSDKYSTMDEYINNLNSDINEISGLLTQLNKDADRGYDVGSSLDTLTFQRDTLSLDRDFFVSQKETYLRKIYKDLFDYTMGIINKCIEIEENPFDETDDMLVTRKLGSAKVFKEKPEQITETDENGNEIIKELPLQSYNMSDVYELLNSTSRCLFELASDIATFDDKINDAESKEKRGFAIGNMILNLKEQKTTLRVSFESYCIRLLQFLKENLKFASKCVKKIQVISAEIKTEEELEELEEVEVEETQE